MQVISDFIASLKWQDIVDILLNSYILFRLYVLFRGSRFIRVAPVIAILWILGKLSMGMGIVLTSWAVQGIMAAAALIIVIVFRDEIAHVFQARNLKSLLWGFPKHTSFTPVEIIVESVYELARKKTGALLVFPKKKEIENLITGGLKWMGTISKEMLLSIFYNGNPVHDGAAVINGDQVTQVGAILPLTKREDLPSHYGTRHRAAVGICEQSDALAVVVSEENGKVTAVQGSELIDISDNIELEDLLVNHSGALYGGTRKSKKKEFAVYGFAAILCFITITGVWFGLSRGKETLTTVKAPIEYTDLGEGIEILDASESFVDLHLSGSQALIKSMKTDQINVRLKLNNTLVGKNRYPISKDSISLPPGVALKKVVPSEVHVTLDKVVIKQLPVQPDWVGKMPEDLIIEKINITPETLEVRGLSRILDNVSTIYTEKIFLDAIRETAFFSVAPELSPASLKLADDAKTKISIQCIVRKRKKEEKQ